MNVTSRAQWGAVRAKPGVLTVAMAHRSEFMVHHSGAFAGQSVSAIQTYCMNAKPNGKPGYKDIDYNFLVRGTTGEIFEGRGWTAVGSHCVGHNTSALGVCVIGVDDLSDAARASLRWLYQQANAKAGHTLSALCHGDAWPTDCPGTVIHHWVHSGGLVESRTLKVMSPPMRGADVEAVQHAVGAEPDGIYGPVTAAAVKRWQKAHGLDDDGIVGPLTRAKMALDS